MHTQTLTKHTTLRRTTASTWDAFHRTYDCRLVACMYSAPAKITNGSGGRRAHVPAPACDGLCRDTGSHAASWCRCAAAFLINWLITWAPFDYLLLYEWGGADRYFTFIVHQSRRLIDVSALSVANVYVEYILAARTEVNMLCMREPACARARHTAVHNNGGRKVQVLFFSSNVCIYCFWHVSERRWCMMCVCSSWCLASGGNVFFPLCLFFYSLTCRSEVWTWRTYHMHISLICWANNEQEGKNLLIIGARIINEACALALREQYTCFSIHIRTCILHKQHWLGRIVCILCYVECWLTVCLLHLFQTPAYFPFRFERVAAKET